MAAMDPRWLPQLSRRAADGTSASDDSYSFAAAAAMLTSPRAFRPPPRPTFPTSCQVFEMFSDGSGREDADLAHEVRMNATTAQPQHEPDLDVPLTDAAPTGFFGQEAGTQANGYGGRPTALHPGVHGPGTLQRPGHHQPSRVPGGDDLGWNDGGRDRVQREVPPKDQRVHEPKMDAPPRSKPQVEYLYCETCGMTSHIMQASGWTCSVCNSMNQHDWSKPMKHETPMGTWMYMPFGTSTPEPVRQSGSQPGTNTRSRQRRRRRHGGPPSQPSTQGGEEQAESEQLTHDPSVQPSERDDLGEAQGPHGAPARVRDAPHAVPRHGRDRAEDPDQQMLELLRRLAGREGNSDRSWTSMKGPQPGVKFRGGAPPPAPVWKYQSSDVRAYEKFERKVRMWQLQIKQYMSSSEAGLMLYTSLQGEAEQQLEFADIEKIYDKSGVDYILEQLKAAFQQKTVYVKRHHLHEYENTGRYQQESIRAYCNRYKRVEAALKAIGVDISLTYDAEARGSRLLDRARLSAEQQRMILVGTNGQLTFDLVASALNMQYPDYKPAPLTVNRDGQRWNGKGGNAHHGPTSSTSSSSNQSSTASGSTRKGDGKFRQARRVFQAVNEGDEVEEEVDNEAAEDDQMADHDEAADDQPEEEELGEEQPDDFAELAEVLTVTAKKLASMTQGRKFKHAPKKSIEQRKKETTCAACGLKGHWAGDAECEVSNNTSFSKDQSKGNGKSHKGSNKTSTNAETSKKVFTVRHYTGFDQEDEFKDNIDESTVHLCRVVFQADAIPHMTYNNTHESIGYMTIDTACQRSCCGVEWHDAHVHHLQNDWFLKPTYRKQSEKFQFGAGQPQTSSTLALLPCGLSEVCCYLGASILDAKIPFLCSLRTLERLGMTLDLGKRVAHFSTLQCDVHLVYVHGHLAVPILDFPQNPSNQLQEIKKAGLTDAEVNVATTAFSFKTNARDLSLPDGSGLSTRADGMAHFGEENLAAGTRSLDPSSSGQEHEHHLGRELPEGPLQTRSMSSCAPKTEPPKSKARGKEPPSTRQMNRQNINAPMPATCPHPSYQRYGNAWGRYARCETCMARWKWVDGEWKSDGFSSTSRPGQPSHLMPTAGVQQVPTPYPTVPEHFATMAMGSMASLEHLPPPLAGLTQAPLPPWMGQTPLPPSTRVRSRAPSMTSSAAGHGVLTEDALQDFDLLMDETCPVEGRE